MQATAAVLKARADLKNFSEKPVTLTREYMAEPMESTFDVIQTFVRRCLDFCFEKLGVAPATDLEVSAAMAISIIALTLVLYYAVAGKRHRRDRKYLRMQLLQAQDEVRQLQEQLDAEESQSNPVPAGKEMRIFVEGAFDVMHYGHANAFRQARALGTYLIAGVNSSESIEQCKGAKPIMSDDERLAVVRACKWVDEVIPNTPYVMTPEYLDWVIETYKIDFVVHGDDACIGPDGKDVYAHVKERGMYRSIPRTEGVSTTEIVGRMLLMDTRHHLPTPDGEGERLLSHSLSSEKLGSLPSQGSLGPYGPYRESRFLTSSRMLRLFSHPPPKPITKETKVVYINGGFDMFHAGHAAILEKARSLGDYLLVGVFNDGVCNHYRGGSHPVLNLNERVLSVLACKYVDDVIIDPPYCITQEMIAALNISAVVTGEITESRADLVEEERNIYRVAEERGILHVIESGSNMSMGSVLSRIRENTERLEAKVFKKMKAEAEHYMTKHGLEMYNTEPKKKR